MQILPPSPFALAAAARCLQEGQLVAFPTETVYGLGADATNDRAVAALFAVKGRPTFNPLIVHVSEGDQVAALARLVTGAEELIARFWPGPLTLVLPRLEDAGISLLCSAGLNTLALRCPAHPTARAMIEAAGLPIAAPSANRSGRVSPTTAEHVQESFGETSDIALLLAGGSCAVGLESTVLDLTTPIPTLLRPGAILPEELEAVLGARVARPSSSSAPPENRQPGPADVPHAPGQLASHYAPSVPVRLNVREGVEPGEAYLAFGPVPLSLRGGERLLNLSAEGDLREAAANLFAFLRALDQGSVKRIAVAPIPEEGLGLAINDRLRRAAHPACGGG